MSAGGWRSGGIGEPRLLAGHRDRAAPLAAAVQRGAADQAAYLAQGHWERGRVVAPGRPDVADHPQRALDRLIIARVPLVDRLLGIGGATGHLEDLLGDRTVDAVELVAQGG